MISSIAGIITLFGFARRLGPIVSRILLGLSAIALLVFGLYQLWAGISGFFFTTLSCDFANLGIGFLQILISSFLPDFWNAPDGLLLRRFCTL